MQLNDTQLWEQAAQLNNFPKSPEHIMFPRSAAEDLTGMALGNLAGPHGQVWFPPLQAERDGWVERGDRRDKRESKTDRLGPGGRGAEREGVERKVTL
jgi:hypothetical protein